MKVLVACEFSGTVNTGTPFTMPAARTAAKLDQSFIRALQKQWQNNGDNHESM